MNLLIIKIKKFHLILQIITFNFVYLIAIDIIHFLHLPNNYILHLNFDTLLHLILLILAIAN